ncbi:hypothetical protein ACLOJK_023969, partial [Asimina triloba]
MAAHNQPIISNPNQIQAASIQWQQGTTHRQQGMAHLHRTVIYTNSGGQITAARQQ